MDKNFDEKIGARIKHFREKAGYTQAQLAELIDCATSTIGHYEIGKGKISLTLLRKIALKLNVDLYKFFIPRIAQEDEKTLQKINALLKFSSKVQLGLIYDTISNILDLT